MTSQRNSAFPLIINLVLVFALLISEFTGGSLLKISDAQPMLILSFFIAMSIFCSELTAAISGLIIGIFIDSSASFPAFFNSLFFMLAGLIISLIIHYYFNNNIRSAIALAIIFSAAYFLLKWLFSFALPYTGGGIFSHLLKASLPSAAYTAAFVIPFYYLERAVFKQRS